MKLPWYVKTLVVIFCLPTILWACATAPQMPPAVPEHIVASFKAENSEAKLYSEPCRNSVIMEFLSKQIPPEALAGVKAASGTYEGKPYGVCWLWNMDESAAVMVWDDGGYFAVPRQLLKFPLAV